MFVTFWLMRSSSSPLIPSFRLMSLIAVRCSKSCRFIIICSFCIITFCLWRLARPMASMSSCLSFCNFWTLWLSLARVFRASLTSRRRKQTYGSPSSLSRPVSNCVNQQDVSSKIKKTGHTFSAGCTLRLPDSVRRELQCSTSTSANIRAGSVIDSLKVSSFVKSS
jgi:hypothetical protein